MKYNDISYDIIDITSIERVPYEGDVYNLEVEKDHSYIVERATVKNCESFTWWAWYHKAYKNDYAYIDDSIPDLNNRLKAPKVNNVSLRGGSCKHILSVLDYIKKPYVLMKIAQDLTDFINGGLSVKDTQDLTTAFQADAVKDWDQGDIENYLGMTRDEIITELKKVIQTNDNINTVQDAITLGLLDDKDLSKLDKSKVAAKVDSELDLEKELYGLLARDDTLDADLRNAMGESINMKQNKVILENNLGGKYKYTIKGYMPRIMTRIVPLIRDLGFEVTDRPYNEEIMSVTYRGMQEDVKDFVYFIIYSSNTSKEQEDKDILELVVSFMGKESDRYSLYLKDSKQMKSAIELALDSIGYDPYREERAKQEEEDKRIKAELEKRKRWKEEEQERQQELDSIEDSEEELVLGKADFSDFGKILKTKDIDDIEVFKSLFKKDFGKLLNGEDPLVAIDKNTNRPIALFKNNVYELDKSGQWKVSPVKW